MSTYYASLTDDGSGNFSVALQRGGTAPSGGTAITIPWVENNNASPAISTTKMLGVAFEVAKRAALNDRAAGN